MIFLDNKKLRNQLKQVHRSLEMVLLSFDCSVLRKLEPFSRLDKPMPWCSLGSIQNPMVNRNFLQRTVIWGLVLGDNFGGA